MGTLIAVYVIAGASVGAYIVGLLWSSRRLAQRLEQLQLAADVLLACDARPTSAA